MMYCVYKKKVSDIKIGEKFFTDDTHIYLRIDLDLPTCSLTTKFPPMICALNLTTYQIECFDANLEVIFEGDNVFI